MTLLLALLVLGLPCMHSASVTPAGDGLLHEAGRCVMMSQCGASDAPGGGFYPCVNNSLAFTVFDGEDMYNLIEQVCPMLVEGLGSTSVCCDFNSV